jgi:acetyl esterase/lipase
MVCNARLARSASEGERSGRSPSLALRVSRLVAKACAALFISFGADWGLAEETRIPDEQIAVLRDLRYREACKSCALDLAMQKDYAGKARPAILVIHGGGWIEGDKSSFATPTNRNPASIIDFARLGFVTLGVNYRLAGEAPFPAALDDCRLVVRWLRANAEKYHVDPDRIGAYGNSAGGHLALLLGLMPPETPAASEPLADRSGTVQAVVSDSGPIDLVYPYQQNQLRGVVEKFMGGPLDDARAATYKRASPSSYVSGRSPPLLLIYGEDDTQVSANTADRFVAALSSAGHKNVSYFRLAGVDHCPHSLIRVGFLHSVVDDFFVWALGKPEATAGR